MQARIAALAEAAGGRKLIVRIDRTELSKNIVRGLAAYRELLATRPEWHGRVMHVAFAYPPGTTCPSTASTPPRCSGWPGRSPTSSAPRTGTR